MHAALTGLCLLPVPICPSNDGGLQEEGRQKAVQDSANSRHRSNGWYRPGTAH